MENPMSLTDPHSVFPSPVHVDQLPVYTITTSSAEITHRLHNYVVALLDPAGLSTLKCPDLPEALVHQLNRLLWEGQRLFECEQRQSWVIAIDVHTVVKIRAGMDMDHISNLDYIKKHAPGLPVPSFLGALRSGIFSYMFMSYVQGVTLESAWPTLTKADKESVQAQLAKILTKLRMNKHSNYKPRLGSFLSHNCKYSRERLLVGKIPTEARLNSFLCNQGGSRHLNAVLEAATRTRENHDVVMTHGDLQPRNILIQIQEEPGCGRRICVTALLHWNLGGWYPEHWESMRLYYLAEVLDTVPGWIDCLPLKKLGQWSIEYAMDLAIRHRMMVGHEVVLEKPSELEREGQP